MKELKIYNNIMIKNLLQRNKKNPDRFPGKFILGPYGTDEMLLSMMLLLNSGKRNAFFIIRSSIFFKEV
jgi:hypothetical protein